MSRAQITWHSKEDPSRSLTQSQNIEIADMKLAIAGARKIQHEGENGKTYPNTRK